MATGSKDRRTKLSIEMQLEVLMRSFKINQTFGSIYFAYVYFSDKLSTYCSYTDQVSLPVSGVILENNSNIGLEYNSLHSVAKKYTHVSASETVN